MRVSQVLPGRGWLGVLPRRIWFVEALPRTATGKVQRGVLADRFLHEMARKRMGA